MRLSSSPIESSALVGAVALVIAMGVSATRSSRPAAVGNGNPAGPAPSEATAPPPPAQEPAPAEPPPAAETEAQPESGRAERAGSGRRSAKAEQAPPAVGGGPPPAAPPPAAPAPVAPQEPAAAPLPPGVVAPVHGTILVEAGVLPTIVKLSGLGRATALRARITFQNTSAYPWTIEPSRQSAHLLNPSRDLPHINETFVSETVAPGASATFTYDYALPGRWIAGEKPENFEISFTGTADAAEGPVFGDAVYRLARSGPVVQSDPGQSMGQLYYNPDWQGYTSFRPRVVKMLQLERVR